MADPTLRELSRPSAWRWTARALGNWAEVAAILCAVGWWNHPVGYVLGMVLLGSRQHALSLLAHDAIHYAAGPNKRVNDWLGCLLAFWPLFGPMDSYRSFHLKHHRTLGRTDDPEHAFKLWTPREWRTPLSLPRALGYVLRDLAGANWRQVFRLGWLTPPQSRRDTFGPPLWWLGANVALYSVGHWWVAWYWWWPYFTSYWAVFRWRGWSEHQATADTHRLHAGPLARFLFLPHNTWLHWEHHLHPTVPCWNLPRVRELVGPMPPIRTVPELFTHFATYRETPWGVPEPAAGGRETLEPGPRPIRD